MLFVDFEEKLSTDYKGLLSCCYCSCWMYEYF